MTKTSFVPHPAKSIENGAIAHRAVTSTPEPSKPSPARVPRNSNLELVELRQRNYELVCQNRELNNFAHVVSHDLRQPLQSILDYLELLASIEDCSRNPDVARWLQSSRKLGLNMQTLINGVLDYATLGTQSMAFQMVDGNAVLQSALENLLAVTRQENAIISYDPLPVLFGSAAFLTRLFQNLIGNAIKYRRDVDPQIRIRCESRDKTRDWLIRVIDNGRGIPPEFLPSIFDMFTRVGDSHHVPGSGVGLAITKRIVELHGGSIWAESKVGKGSVFHIVFPSFDSKFFQAGRGPSMTTQPNNEQVA